MIMVEAISWLERGKNMLINEAAKKCNITKKAIQYYVEQGLITPNVLENGYKDFSEDEVKRLKQIVLYRRLDLSISEIKKVFVNPGEIKSILYQRTLELEREKVKQELLERLNKGEDIEKLEKEINTIDSKSIIVKKLMELFPSYYGKFISLNFSRYLTGSIETEEQMEAFSQIIEFFDNAPEIEIPEDLKAYLDEYLEFYSGEEGTEKINSIIQGKEKAFQNIDEFVKANKQILDNYMEYKQSEEYKNSPAYKFMELMKEFCQTNGYYDIFIPAMRKLSPLYNQYYEQMLVVNEEFEKKYPEYMKK